MPKWDGKANGLPNRELEHNKGLIPRMFTKIMIIVLISSGIVVVGLQVKNPL
jgi:hypothetical protein